MSVFGSQSDLNMVRMVDSKPDLSGGETQSYGWVSTAHGVGNGQQPFKDRQTYTITRSFKGGEAGGMRYKFIIILLVSSLRSQPTSAHQGDIFVAVSLGLKSHEILNT